MNPSNPPLLDTILPDAVALIQNNIFAGASTALVLMLIYGGYMRLTAADSPQKVKKANATIMFAVIGYFLVLLSFFIIDFVSTKLGNSLGTDVTF